MLTVDASVWVNADSPAEPESASSRAFLDQVAAVRPLSRAPEPQKSSPSLPLPAGNL